MFSDLYPFTWGFNFDRVKVIRNQIPAVDFFFHINCSTAFSGLGHCHLARKNQLMCCQNSGPYLYTAIKSLVDWPCQSKQDPAHFQYFCWMSASGGKYYFQYVPHPLDSHLKVNATLKTLQSITASVPYASQNTGHVSLALRPNFTQI
jgi:hypothetical protein